MNNNKLAFLLILFFDFSAFCMDETKPTLSQEETDEAIAAILAEEDISAEDFQENSFAQDEVKLEDIKISAGFNKIDLDLPPLSLFLRDRELLDIEEIIEELKKAKKKNRNLQGPGLLLHGPEGNGKLTIAQIVSEEAGWTLVAMDAQRLIKGKYLFAEDEALINEQISEHIKNIEQLNIKAKSKDNKNIRNIIRALLYIISKKPVILFLHNVEVLFDEKNSAALDMFIDSFKYFKSLELMFLIGSTRDSNIVTNRLTTELLYPIHIQLPDWKKRDDILKYYFNKYDIWINAAVPGGPLLGLAMQTKKAKEYAKFLKAKPEERILRDDLFIILIGITKNFSGGDLEELVLSVNHAINANVTRAHEVWSIDILKDSYCWDDVESGFISSLRFGLSLFELLTLPLERYNDNGPHEYFFSLVMIQKEILSRQQRHLI